MDRTLKIRDCDWQIVLLDETDEGVGNVVIERERHQNFHATMVNDSVEQPNGELAHFRQLMFFEHDQGNDKIGDIVIVFRMNPHTKRYHVQVETENIFITETNVEKTIRVPRSSVDNVAQAIKGRPIIDSGWLYTNPRRISGKRMQTHYVFAGWAPSLVGNMMDVFDFVEIPDALGIAAFQKALRHMRADQAQTIYEQMRTPLIEDEN